MVALLSGLFGQSVFAKSKPKPCKYGGPPPRSERPRINIDSLEQKQDTVVVEPMPAPEPQPTPPPPEPQPCKYGPPGGNWD